MIRDYEMLELLGEGSTARVYRVRHRMSGEEYAVKVSDNLALLQKESALLNKLKHQAFPRWVTYMEKGGWGYLVMELVEGRTLQDLMESGDLRMPALQAVDLLLELLEALAYLHRQEPEILYRDLKPRNIMIDERGMLKLIDLGSAVDCGCRVGTYGYAAPEQFWEGVKLSPACDIYAAGKVLAWLLTGKNPWEPPYDMLEFCRKDRLVPTELLVVLERALAVESMGRIASAGEFARMLRVQKGRMESKRRLAWGSRGRACENGSRFEWSGQRVCRNGSRFEWSGQRKISRIFWKRIVFGRRKSRIIYEKCVWKSEYQRIF